MLGAKPAYPQSLNESALSTILDDQVVELMTTSETRPISAEFGVHKGRVAI